jgi:hypothetical protein
MTLKFDRIQAGEYQITDNNKTVGYVKKQGSSKWLMYKCSNPAILGNPICVKKTLKELKVQAEILIGSTPAPEKAENSVELDTFYCDLQSKDPEKYDLMKEMLDKDYVISLNEYSLVDPETELAEVLQQTVTV